MWYVYNANATSNVELTLTANLWDMELDAFSGATADVTTVTFISGRLARAWTSAISPAYPARFELAAVSGTTYYIRVGSQLTTTNYGTFVMCSSPLSGASRGVCGCVCVLNVGWGGLRLRLRSLTSFAGIYHHLAMRARRVRLSL